MNFPIDPERIMQMPIRSIDKLQSPWTPGDANDFYSEADYWWQNPDDPDGAYICRDGMSNPDCFNRHRKLVLYMSCQVAGLTLAYLEKGNQKYLEQIDRILRAWFINSATAMRPHLNYSQAIRKKVSGRCYGVIDTVHLPEVALCVEKLRNFLPADTVEGCIKWFENLLDWLIKSELGSIERSTTNNHSVCWYMQAATYARLCGKEELLQEFRRDFKDTLLEQIAVDGSCPRETARTKPYGYSLFVLEAFAGVAAVLTTKDENYFTVTGKSGQSVAKAMEFITPFIADKSLWQLPPDVLYDKYWPCRQSALYLSAYYLQKNDYKVLYDKLSAPAAVFEVLRNFPIRHPQLWI